MAFTAAFLKDSSPVVKTGSGGGFSFLQSTATLGKNCLDFASHREAGARQQNWLHWFVRDTQGARTAP